MHHFKFCVPKLPETQIILIIMVNCHWYINSTVWGAKQIDFDRGKGLTVTFKSLDGLV